jgi:hypothetical protein
MSLDHHNQHGMLLWLQIWSLCCGYIIRHSCSSLHIYFKCIYDISSFNIKSTYSCVWRNSILCTSSVCLPSLTIMTTSHHVGSSCIVSQETQNPKRKTPKDTAMCELGITLVFLTSYLRYYASWTHIIFTETLPILSQNYHKYSCY